MRNYKALVLVILGLITAIFTGCNSNTGNTTEHSHAEMNEHKHQHQQMKHDNNQMMEHDQEAPETISISQNDQLSPLINAYLELKNALVNDDQSGAASAAKKILETLPSIQSNQEEGSDIIEDIKEQAEHISKSEIEHQREHLQMLSEDMKDLIKIMGADRELYVAFCPMANDGQGAIWISEIKEIKNPYYGKEMLTCGSIKQILTYEAQNN